MYKLLILTLLFFVQDIVASDNQAAIVTFIEAKPVSDQTTNDEKDLDAEHSEFFRFLDNNDSQNNGSTLPVFVCLQDIFTQEGLRQYVTKSAAEQKKVRQELSSFAKAHGYKCS